jgi:hypothetical protein
MAQGAAYVFVADMDVDCDGIDYKCKVCFLFIFQHKHTNGENATHALNHTG